VAPDAPRGDSSHLFVLRPLPARPRRGVSPPFLKKSIGRSRPLRLGSFWLRSLGPVLIESDLSPFREPEPSFLPATRTEFRDPCLFQLLSNISFSHCRMATLTLLSYLSAGRDLNSPLPLLSAHRFFLIWLCDPFSRSLLHPSGLGDSSSLFLYSFNTAYLSPLPAPSSTSRRGPPRAGRAEVCFASLPPRYLNLPLRQFFL